MSTILLLRNSAVSLADDEKLEVVTNNPFVALWRSNFVLRDPIIAELQRKIEDRLVPISISGELVKPVDAIKNAENAIKNAELETTSALRKYIAALDPTTFELLVSVVFLKLGYKNVVVTKAKRRRRNRRQGNTGCRGRW